MTSVSSRGPTPHSPYEMESAADTEESWQYMDFSASYPSSVGFLPSPASGGSLSSYAVVGNVANSDHAGLSPLDLDLGQAGCTSAGGFADQSETFTQPAPSDAVSYNLATASLPVTLTPQQYLFSQVNESLLNSLQDQAAPFTGLESFGPQEREIDINLAFSQTLRSHLHQEPWNTANLKVDDNGSTFLLDGLLSSPQTSASTSPDHSHVTSPDLKYETAKASSSASSSVSTRKVMNGKVGKKKATFEPASRFVIVTPDSITARGGRTNLYECFENMRTNPRGRKGPLGNATKQSALQVPQVICWQFSDFLTVLFPEFMRSHFRKDQMSRFMQENVDLESMDELDPRQLDLSSGLASVLSVTARFFQPKTSDVQQHYHLQVGRDRIDLQARSTAPMVLELNTTAQRDALRKKAREYIAAVFSEPWFAQRVTESIRHTELPKKILAIVQSFANKTDSTMVKKALAIYSAHFIMTRHLCITRSSVMSLQDSGLVPAEGPWVTPRVLNRQIKAVIDDLLARDMSLLFESFSKSLKPKSRREWAPCLAAFLVLCLFMEAVETAADTFVVALKEISLRTHTAPEYKRQDALNINKEMENLPFKQFAYQFHQVYQTHSRDSSMKPFNPLMDNAWVQQDDIDGPAADLVVQLRDLLQLNSGTELDVLATDPILDNDEEHPFPRDVAVNYTGRMVAKFLLSFEDEKYIFGDGAL
ncbi:hypothetical protein CTRI78_v004228 [Colletotrichum trifolii]|uniref:Uncharacterized protein n=1 Tax=Colletotrichum trifolii TaxID=5466 RepID=A0A4R8RKT6_COLTR|nr:hypothetical protein CTRI78_v004228 [Colletotrichum trifolii]